jgi:hypothetical protein
MQHMQHPTAIMLMAAPENWVKSAVEINAPPHGASEQKAPKSPNTRS